MLKTTLEAQAILTDAISKTSEVYTEALAAVMKALADLPRESGELHRRAVEQWLGLARTNKENFVAAVNQHPSPGRRMRHEINYAYRHGPILVNTKKGRVKDRNMRERSDVAILCVNPANPYHWMAINGKVAEMIEETDPVEGREATDNVNELARRYINTTPYPLRDPKGEVRVLFKVRPTYVMTFGPPPNS
jgi:hypothetical protein